MNKETIEPTKARPVACCCLMDALLAVRKEFVAVEPCPRVAFPLTLVLVTRTRHSSLVTFFTTTTIISATAIKGTYYTTKNDKQQLFLSTTTTGSTGNNGRT